jgi:hypothetical protein
VAVVAIACYHLIAGATHRLQAHGDGLLANVEVAEAPDQAHAVELAGAFLEAADEQHVAVEPEHVDIARLRLGVRLPARHDPLQQLPANGGREASAAVRNDADHIVFRIDKA